MMNLFRMIHLLGVSTVCVSGNSAICSISGLPTTKASNLTLNDVLGVVFYIIGSLTVLMIVIGGIMLITSEGNPQKVANARKTIIYTIVGGIITASATTIIDIVMGNIKV